MSNNFEERRQEPRFLTDGRYHFDSSSEHGRIFDLSLNGAMLERLPHQQITSGDRTKATLHFPGHPAFTVDLKVVHVGKERIGVEFYDTDPQSFATLAQLIEVLSHSAS